jgi:hypothetical protein
MKIYSKNRVYYTYLLIDSRNNLPFYVGKGKGRRMFIHVKSSLQGKILHNNKKKHYKIRSIFKNHGKVLYKKFIKGVNETVAFNFEKLLVKKYGKENLCNLTNGGDGGGIYFTLKVRRKMSLAAKGKIVSKETREKISKAFKGKNHPLYGKHHSKEAIMKMKKSSKERWLKSLEKIKTSKGQKERFKMQEHPRGMLGKKHSEETKKKMSDNSRWKNK